MMARQYEARHGHIDLGNEPGLGIVYDEKRLKKTQVE
jgi:L-alanine-DL-glutamate epimerase-like enolase superfamily enzyme